MTKKKLSDGSEQSEIITIERGPWEIDKAHVTKVEPRDGPPAEVIVYTERPDGSVANYSLTPDEAAPFLSSE